MRTFKQAGITPIPKSFPGRIRSSYADGMLGTSFPGCFSYIRGEACFRKASCLRVGLGERLLWRRSEGALGTNLIRGNDGDVLVVVVSASSDDWNTMFAGSIVVVTRSEQCCRLRGGD